VLPERPLTVSAEAARPHVSWGDVSFIAASTGDDHAPQSNAWILGQACAQILCTKTRALPYQQVGPPGQGPGSEASAFRENADTQYWKTSAITSSHFVPTYCIRGSVPFNVEGNEAEKDAVCPSLP